jgi:hypothetical protein
MTYETTILTLNRAKCRSCGDILTSTHRHDFKWCKCENIAVDGGLAYIRRAYNDSLSIEEMSEYRDKTLAEAQADLEYYKEQSDRGYSSWYTQMHDECAAYVAKILA